MMKKEAVAVLGATGGVGQWLLHLLQNHPYYTLVHLAASEKSVKNRYEDAVKWSLPFPIPEAYKHLPVSSCKDPIPCRIVFSALPAEVGSEIELSLISKGHWVFSNSSQERLSPDIPLIIPEVNGEDLLAYLQTLPKGKGFLVKNPNCNVAGLAVALKPLHRHFGIDSLSVTTLQAVSGAGLAAKATMPIADNVIPFISGEEEKIEKELPKILGRYRNGKFLSHKFPISAHCNRVHVSDGHTACVSIKLLKKASEEEIASLWDHYLVPLCVQKCVSLPKKTVSLLREENFPQPKLHRMEGNGMTVSIGRLRTCSLLDFKFTLLSHNMVRGSAGLSLLNAELCSSYIS